MGRTDTPKSHAGRVVPMAPEVARALTALRQREAVTGPRDLVFIGQGGGHVDLSTFRGRFVSAQQRAKVSPVRDVRQLRNTFGTVTAGAGIPLRTIQQWMGHESISTTEIYASFMPGHEDAAVVSRAFGGGSFLALLWQRPRSRLAVWPRRPRIQYLSLVG
jgi:site-specific recombinase XerD